MGIEQLENKGFAFINKERLNNKKRQIIVIGSARGGTSLVSGALHHLGIFTGKRSSAPVFEDVLLSDAFESNNIKKATAIIDEYSREHDVWAWKRPKALHYLDLVENTFPNPLYIFIFKDIFSIANRNNISMQADVVQGLQNALNDYTKIVNFVAKTKAPSILVSAEKALLNKEAFVETLIDINKSLIDCSENDKQAINFITPNPQDYLDKSRISRSIGFVDRHNKHYISGWAKSAYNEATVIVELLANDQVIAECEANLFRKDLKDKKIHSTGLCGFKFELSNLSAQQLDNVLDVKVKNDIRNLNKGSNLKCN